MVIWKLKNITGYWDTRESQSHPFFAKTMSYNKFAFILWNLQLTTHNGHPRGHPEFDHWFKVRYLLDHLNRSFKKYFVPGQNVCLDESLIGLKNRCAYIQYLPKKHKQFGIKKFETCDSATNYVLHLKMYSGADFLIDKPGPFAQKCVLEVMEKSGLLDKGHHLFTDQFYTKVPLALKLHERNTYLTGTINKNSQYLATTLKNTELEAGQTLYFRHKDVLLATFKQNASRKSVFALTTACHAEDKLVQSKK